MSATCIKQAWLHVAEYKNEGSWKLEKSFSGDEKGEELLSLGIFLKMILYTSSDGSKEVSVMKNNKC